MRPSVPRLFYRPDGFTLVRGAEVTEIAEPFSGHGMGHEAEEVMRCLRAGLTESPLVPLGDTLAVMEILDETRGQIGVTYD